MVYVDRHEIDGAWDRLRSVLLMNDGHGRFKPVTTQRSGIDTNAIAVEAADLDGDGLLDLYFNGDPENTYPFDQPPLPEDRFLDKIYWNARFGRADRNHWLRLRLEGRKQRKLIGATILLRSGGELLGRRDYFSADAYKVSHGYEAHFGLGKHRTATAVVRLPNGAVKRFRHLRGDRVVRLDVGRRKAPLDEARPTTAAPDHDCETADKCTAWLQSMLTRSQVRV
jgi:hypothetical protein